MKTETKQTWAGNTLILLATLGRLLPHLPNVTPMGAVSLVGGAKLSRFWRWSIPFVALILSDILLGAFKHFSPWSLVTPFIYAAFAINILLGTKVGKENPYRNLTFLSIIGSLQFFLLSNFGVWMEGLLYPRTGEGLVACYVSAIPFLQNTLLGDLGWSLALFFVLSKATTWITKTNLQTNPL